MNTWIKPRGAINDALPTPAAKAIDDESDERVSGRIRVKVPLMMSDSAGTIAAANAIIDQQRGERLAEEFMRNNREAPAPSQPQPTTDAVAYWNGVMADRQREHDAQMERYRQIGADAMNPTLAYDQFRQHADQNRAAFDAACRSPDTTAIDKEWSEYRDQLGGRPAPTPQPTPTADTQSAPRTLQTLDQEYLDYCAELSGGGRDNLTGDGVSNGPKVAWID